MAKKDFEFTNEELADIAIACKDFQSPAFQFYVNDILGSNKVLMMDAEAVAGYFLLLVSEWNEPDCGLPTEDNKLVKLSRLFPDVWEKVKEQILGNFFLYKGRFYNRRLLKERKKQINMRNQRVDAVRKRYEKPTGEEIPEDVIEDENENIKNKIKGTQKVGEREVVIKDYFLDLLPVESKQNFIEAWVEWVDFRKELKKKLTVSTAKKQISFLLNQQSPVECICQSIEKGWMGLFEIKGSIPVKESYTMKEALAIDPSLDSFNKPNPKVDKWYKVKK